MDPVSAENRMESIEKRLRDQRALLEKSRRQQREARARALRIEREAGVSQGSGGDYDMGGIGSAAEVWDSSGDGGDVQLRKDVLAGLRDPAGLKKAILYREILGPPLGLR